jgi:predicted kinase
MDRGIFMRYSESYTNAGLSVVSPEGLKLTEQGIDGGGRCAIAIPLADEIIFPNRSQEHSIMLPVDTQWRPSRNWECFVGTDRLTVVLMAGLPGAGKTTLAYALKELLGWQVIDKDWYKEELLKQDVDDDSASRIAYNRSFEEMRTALAELHTSVILDSAALHQFILDEAMQIVCDVPNVRLKVILCVADRDLRIERLYTRPYHHPNPKVDPTADVDDLYYFGHLPPDKLVLSMDRPLDECLAEAREYVLR